MRATKLLRDSMDKVTIDSVAIERHADETHTLRQKTLALLRETRGDATPWELRAQLNLPIWTATERHVLTARANAAAIELATRFVSEPVAATPVDVRSRSVADPWAATERLRLRRATNLLSLIGEPMPDANGWRAALSNRLLDRFQKEKSPEARARFDWLIHPDDLPATPKSPDQPANDSRVDARRDSERATALWLAEKRMRPLANELSGQPSESAKGVARDLNEATRILSAWPR